MKNCSYCGRENPDEAIYCQECGTEFITQSSTPVPPAQNKSPSAGFKIRALARIIDSLFGSFIGFEAGILGHVILRILSSAGIVHGGWEYRLHRFSLISFALGLLGAIGFHSFCEGIHGATPGKLCCGIRVISEGGKTADMKGAFIRSAAYYLDGLFFGLIGYSCMKISPLNQRHGDIWGKTVVVKVAELPAESQETKVSDFILGFLAGFACWMSLLTASIIIKAL